MHESISLAFWKMQIYRNQSQVNVLGVEGKKEQMKGDTWKLLYTYIHIIKQLCYLMLDKNK
jgi:hypothetical protein